MQKRAYSKVSKEIKITSFSEKLKVPKQKYLQKKAIIDKLVYIERPD